MQSDKSLYTLSYVLKTINLLSPFRPPLPRLIVIVKLIIVLNWLKEEFQYHRNVPYVVSVEFRGEYGNSCKLINEKI